MTATVHHLFPYLDAERLDDAARLRKEAEALLAEYKQKRTDAEKEAAAIVAHAKTDAEEYAAETRRKLAESLERRTRQAEQKIIDDATVIPTFWPVTHTLVKSCVKNLPSAALVIPKYRYVEIKDD